MVAGMTLSPSSRVTVCTGRTKCTSPLRPNASVSGSAVSPAKSQPYSAAVLRCFRPSHGRDTAAIRLYRWSDAQPGQRVIPQPRAQPSAALLGLPSASNAWAIAGPRFSDFHDPVALPGQVSHFQRQTTWSRKPLNGAVCEASVIQLLQ